MDIKILQQPDDVTCGPTSLQAVYNHLGYKIPLKQLISEIEFLEDGGTLGVFLGIDALKRGFKVTLHSYNLTLLDPTWSELSMPELKAKLELLHKAKHAPKLRKAIEAYIRFIDLGGTVAFSEQAETIFTPSATGNCRIQWSGNKAWCEAMLAKIRRYNMMH